MRKMSLGVGCFFFPRQTPPVVPLPPGVAATALPEVNKTWTDWRQPPWTPRPTGQRPPCWRSAWPLVCSVRHCGRKKKNDRWGFRAQNTNPATCSLSRRNGGTAAADIPAHHCPPRTCCYRGAKTLTLSFFFFLHRQRTARQSPEDKAPATTRATTATSSTTSASGGGLSRSASFLALLDQRCQALLSAVVPEEIVLARDVEAEDMEEGIVMLAKQTAPPVEEALEGAEVSPAVVASPTATETPPASSEPQARASSTHRRRKHKSAAKQKPAADTAVPSVALEPPTQSASPPVSSTEVSAAPSPTLSTCHHEDDEDMLSSFTPNDAIPSTCVLPPNLRSPMRYFI